MDGRIENLLGLMRERIKSTSDDKFLKLSNMVLKNLAKKDNTIKARTNR